MSPHGSWCSAPNCYHSKKKRPDLTFFRFPKEEDRCNLWSINSGRQDLLNKSTTYLQNNLVLCSYHFEDNQFMNSKRNKLVWNAIPTIFDIPKRLPYLKRAAGQKDHKKEDLGIVGNMNNLCSSIKSSTDGRQDQTNEVGVHYEVMVQELDPLLLGRYSLSEIRSSYPIPTDWTMCIKTDTIFFVKINETTNYIITKFILRKDMTTSIQALGKDLDPAHPLLRTFPGIVSDSKMLDNCFLLLNSWNTCKGSEEKTCLSSLSSSEKVNEFFSHQTGSVHSLKCMLLTNDRTARCEMCQLERMTKTKSRTEL